MGSSSDWPIMQKAQKIFDEFGISVERKVLSAHRMPEEMIAEAKAAQSNGYDIIIAGAGGAAHLPGMMASASVLPVIGVPVKASHLDGMDSLLSIVQMPRGIPVATVGINKADNAALLALQILALKDENLSEKLKKFKQELSKMSQAQQADLIL